MELTGKAGIRKLSGSLWIMHRWNLTCSMLIRPNICLFWTFSRGDLNVDVQSSWPQRLVATPVDRVQVTIRDTRTTKLIGSIRRIGHSVQINVAPATVRFEGSNRLTLTLWPFKVLFVSRLLLFFYLLTVSLYTRRLQTQRLANKGRSLSFTAPQSGTVSLWHSPRGVPSSIQTGCQFIHTFANLFTSCPANPLPSSASFLFASSCSLHDSLNL